MTKKGKGRPRININKTEFEKLCEIQATLEEIAGWFKCSEDTIQNFCKREYEEIFSVVYKRHAARGKISVRRSQFRIAERNPAMAIFLGKQYLGQSDRPDFENEQSSRIEEILKAVKNDQ